MELWFIICGALSFALLCFALIYFLCAGSKKSGAKRVLSPFLLLTLGVFAATFVMFLPIYYTSYDFGDAFAWVRPALNSFHHAIKVFIVDEDFDTVKAGVSGIGGTLHAVYSLYAAILYVLAPILTFGNVLSLFKNLKHEFLFALRRRRPFYVFSELNERSITLAESIAETKKREKPILVFTSVNEKDDGSDYELLLRARDVGALLLKKEISRVNADRKKGRVECFLICDDESENVEQAIKLNKANSGHKDRAIYLFSLSSNSSAGMVIDSLDKGPDVVNESLERAIERNSEDVVYGNWLDESDLDVASCYYIRRIDTVENLAVSVLSSPELLGPLFAAVKRERRISLLLLGVGEYGRAFLKTALWMYQICGCALEITVMDRAPREQIESVLRRECPDVRLNETFDEPGSENYRIRIMPQIDFETFALEEALLSKDERHWVDGVRLAVVALGDDDRNVGVSVELRRIFDIVNGSTDRSDSMNDVGETPLICSVVYDEKKASNMSCGEGKTGIVDYKGHAYHISFVGDLKSRYSYSVIDEMKTLEKEAIKVHFDWIRNTSKLRDCFENEKYDGDADVLAFREDVERYFTDIGEVRWGDEHLFVTGADSKQRLSPSEIKKTVADYMCYEYYRDSSIMKALHKKYVVGEFEELFADPDEKSAHRDDLYVCACERCRKTRINEHMRWNAYMRSKGYRWGKDRCVRAKIHPDLVPWDELPILDRYKD